MGVLSIRAPPVRFTIETPATAIGAAEKAPEDLTMKYMLLTYLDEKAWEAMTPAQQKAEMLKCEPHVKRLVAEQKVLDGAPLHPTSTATTLRPRAGKPLITDGPFAEAREQLGGYTLIEAADLDEAIAIAAGFMTDSTLASIEVRPVVEFSLETMEARS